MISMPECVCFLQPVYGSSLRLFFLVVTALLRSPCLSVRACVVVGWLEDFKEGLFSRHLVVLPPFDWV